MHRLSHHAIAGPALVAVAIAALSGGWLSLPTASAQIGPPPATFFGTVNDEAGVVPEGLEVQAFIGDVECSDGQGTTGFQGDGDDRVTLYVVDVLDAAQRDGCGEPGAEVRIQIGDRFAEQTGTWTAGVVRLDFTFGDVTPVPIPTITPSPPDSPPDSEQTPGATAAGSLETATAAAATDTAGGVTSNDPGSGNGSSDDDGGGMPVWIIVMLVVGGIAVVGGGVGYLVSRANRDDDDLLSPPPGDF